MIYCGQQAGLNSLCYEKLYFAFKDELWVCPEGKLGIEDRQMVDNIRKEADYCFYLVNEDWGIWDATCLAIDASFTPEKTVFVYPSWASDLYIGVCERIRDLGAVWAPDVDTAIVHMQLGQRPTVGRSEIAAVHTQQSPGEVHETPSC